MSTPSLAQLKRAITISEKIEELQAELQSILGSSGSTSAVAPTGKRKYTKRVKTEASSEAAPAKKKKRKVKMSAEGRAAIVAAQKARWAKVKKDKAK